MENEIESILSLRVNFETETNYNKLGEYVDIIENSIKSKPLTCEESLFFAAILQRRGEWHEATRVLAKHIIDFPHSADGHYELALNAIDAQYYDIAKNSLEILLNYRNELSGAHLRGIWRASSLIGFHDNALIAIETSQKRGLQFHTQAVKNRIITAIENQKNAEIPIISLGENCIPWMIANRWGLRAKPWEDCENYSFNLGQSNIKGIANAILNEANDFVNNDSIEVIFNNNEVPLPCNRNYSYEFNHEQGREWVAPGFNSLRARFDERAENFQRALKNGPNVFVFYTELDGDPVQVANALSKVIKHENYHLLILDSNLDRKTDLINSKHVTYEKISKPSTDYIWFKPDHLDSENGIEFERNIQNLILKCVAKLR